jgi:hypothetical protein
MRLVALGGILVQVMLLTNGMIGLRIHTDGVVDEGGSPPMTDGEN